MKKEVITATKTSRAVHVSVVFVVITAVIVALFGVAAILGRMLTS